MASRSPFLLGLLTLLLSSPPGRAQKEEALPERVLLRLGEGERGHRGPVQGVAFSPLGDLVVSTGADRSMRLWGAASGALLRKWDLPSTSRSDWGNDAVGLTFGRDGKQIFAGQSDGKVRSWDVATGLSDRELEAHGFYLTDLALARDGKLLVTAGRDGKVSLWDAEKGLAIAEIAIGRFPDATIPAVAVQAGIVAVSGGTRRGLRDSKKADTLHLFDTAGKPIRSFRPSDSPAHGMRLTPDGELLVCAGETLQIWETKTGKHVRDIKGVPGYDWRTKQGGAFCISRDGKYVAAAAGRDILILDLLSGDNVATLRGHKDGANTMDFSPLGTRLVSGSQDGTIILWDLVGKKKAKADLTPSWHALLKQDGAAGFEALGELVQAGDDAVAFLAERIQPIPERLLADIPGWIKKLDGTPESRASVRKTLAEFGVRAQPSLFGALREKQPDETRKDIERILEVILDFPIAPEDLRQFRAVQALERIGTPAARKLLAKLAADRGPLGHEAAFVAGRLDARAGLEPVVVLSDEELRDKTKTWPGSRDPVALKAHRQAVFGVTFSRDGKRLASAGKDGMIHVHDLSDGKEPVTLSAECMIYEAVFSPSGDLLAGIGPDGFVQLWDLPKGSEKARLKGHKQHMRSIAFAPDGKTLATGDVAGMLGIWDVAGEKNRFLVKSHVESLTALAFLPDGKSVLVGGVVTQENNFFGQLIFLDPAPLQIWDAASGKPGRKLAVRGSTFALAGDGRTLVAGGLFHLFAKDRRGGALVTINDLSFFQERRHLWHDVATDVELRVVSERGEALAGVGPFIVSGKGYARADPTVRGSNTYGCNAEDDVGLRLFDVISGQEICKRDARKLNAVAFAPSGHVIAWGDEDGKVFLWDLRPRAAAAELDVEQAWARLTGADAALAWQAQWDLAGRPDKSLPFLKEKLRPAPKDLEAAVTRWIKQLGSAEFKERDAASRELEERGRGLEPALEQALREARPVEVQRRLERLLKDMRSRGHNAAELGALRALQALAWMDNPEARRLVEELANGAPLSSVTQEARRLGGSAAVP